MRTKKTRILAIVALAFVVIFAVSLTLVFIDMKNPVYIGLALTSGLIGLALFFIVRAVTKEKKYLVTEVNEEPEGEGAVDGKSPAGVADEAGDETKNEERKTNNGG